MGCMKCVVVVVGVGLNIELSLACHNCCVEKRSRGGFGWLPWPTVPKAGGASGLITGQRGANCAQLCQGSTQWRQTV